MGSSQNLQIMFEELLGTKNVYFQPPATVQMSYPAVVYKRNKLDANYANNKPYTLQKSYTVTVIGEDPEEEFVDKVAMLPKCKHDRHYVSNNLHHDVFTLFY